MNKTTTKTKKASVKKPLIAPNTIIKLVIPKKDAESAYAKALKKLAKKVKVDGFRKGNVPAKIAEESLNPQSVVEEALQLIVPELYTKEVKKSGKQPLTHPEFNPISLKKGEDWVLEAHIAERPEINLKSYKETVKKAKKQATKELETQIKKTTEEAKKHEKECKDDKHDHKSPKPTAEEKKNFTLQFIYRELVEKLKIEVQELLVKEEVRFDLDNLNNQLKQMNIPFEKFLEHRKMTFEQLSTELAAGALSRIQMSFIISEIANTEKMTVEKADLDAEFAKITDENTRKQQEANPRYIDMISQNILRQKVADYLLALK
jgi:FKBP-type peptidyl-prolyl cis-trans isomerase (trigger factor)